MTDGTHYELIQREEVPIEGIGAEGLTTLFAGGIVNPMGPTLLILALDGPATPGSQRYVLDISLNPFSSEASRFAIARIGASMDLWSTLEVVLGVWQQQKGCPTLLFPSALMSDEASRATWAHALSGFRGAAQTAASVRRFPGDPWKRVSDDINGPSESKNAERLTNELSAELANELASIQLDPDNIKKELAAFIYAWNGAIDFVGATPLGAAAMPVEELGSYISLIASTTQLPGLNAP